MSSRFEAALTVLLTASALFMAGLVGWRHLGSPTDTSHPAKVQGWEQIRDGEKQVGSREPLMHIVEFVDLECPFCRRFHEDLKGLLSDYPDDVAVTFYHFPLTSIHPTAEVAGIAMECAGEQGRLVPFMDAAFESQDSLALIDWPQFAQEQAGLENITAYEDCLVHHGPAAVEADMQLGTRLSVSATPTIIINGWRFPAPPTGATVREFLESLRKGEDPFD
jgi:protein-disulfide isomerase